MAKKVNKKKAFLCFLWWTVFYLPVVIYYVYRDLNINLLSITDMQNKYDGFISGQWAMDTTDTLLFLGTVVLFFPVWIIGTVILYQINFKCPKLFKIREKSFKQKLVLNVHNDGVSKPKMPIKLKLQSAGQFSSLHTQQPDTPRPVISDETHALLSAVEKNGTDQIISQLMTIAQAYGAECFVNIDLDGYQIPLAISTDDETAVLITIVNEQNSQLIIDTSDGINGDWFGTMTPLPSPAKFIKEGATKLLALEPSSRVIPVIVLASGEITDCAEVVHMLNQNGIILTRFNQGKPDILETIEEFLDKILSHNSSQTNTNTEDIIPDIPVMED